MPSVLFVAMNFGIKKMQNGKTAVEQILAHIAICAHMEHIKFITSGVPDIMLPASLEESRGCLATLDLLIFATQAHAVEYLHV